MATVTENKAAWLTAAMAHPLKVDTAPMPTPKDNQLVVQVHAVAINPADAGIQSKGIIADHYPLVTGCDFAGVVTAVGATANNVYAGSAQKFEVGDRVVGCAFETNEDGMGAFQLLTTADPRGCAKLPNNITFSDACVLPLCFSTAAAGLFEKDTLALPLPGTDKAREIAGKTIFVWGGSSSVGTCAIQLLKALGLRIVATAGKANIEYCKKLGADMVLDYKSESIIEDAVSALKGQDFIGAFDAMLAPDTIVQTAKIVSQVDGKKFVSTVAPPGFPLPPGRAENVGYGYTDCASIKKNEIGEHLWGGWITSALQSGDLKCLPEKKVVGKGLDGIQQALDVYGKGSGVSAQKLVVEYV